MWTCSGGRIVLQCYLGLGKIMVLEIVPSATTPVHVETLLLLLQAISRTSWKKKGHD